MNKSGFETKKPISVWNKSIKLDYKNFFKSLAGVAIKGTCGNWAEASQSAVESLAALGLQEDYCEVAWLLINKSLIQAIYNLVEENNQLFISRDVIIDIDELVKNLNFSVIENMEITIDRDFLTNPKENIVINEVKNLLLQWLLNSNLSLADAKAISSRLPSYFVFALNNEWRNHPQSYNILKEAIDTPFVKASEREQSWMFYKSWLQKQVEMPMFAEAFSLKQVYIPLSSYYQQKNPNQMDPSFKQHNEEEYLKIVVDLEAALRQWINEADQQDSIRLISGGPGCGKSSFAKIFAAKLAEENNIPLLFIPLHNFELTNDLAEAIGTYVKYNRFFTYNPLDPSEGEERLLLIFDGLDELALQGKLSTEIAQQFIREIQKYVSYNITTGRTRLQILVTGRELVVQSNANEFRKTGQILNILPYYVPEEDRKLYIDDNNLLEVDKRNFWWNSYGEASGQGFTSMPNDLKNEKLSEVTSQPLLNYLVALSYARKKINFSIESNLNAIYADLVKAVYERGWADCQHAAIKGIAEEQFYQVLEEIAIAAWHGAGRTTTVKDIETHCEQSGIKTLLNTFEEGAAKGVTRLLTAFYFRQSGRKTDGDKTFEFTHKSFSEYLTAKRIVRQLRITQEMFDDRKKSIYKGWDEKEALKCWILLCAKSPIDKYIFSFICDELLLEDIHEIEKWQLVISKLIGYMLKNGMPFEMIQGLTYNESVIQSRNAEEALLAVLSACSRVTNKISNIDWPSETSFGAWVSRMQSQRKGPENTLAFKCFNYLNLRGCVMDLKDFFRANFFGSDLSGAKMQLSILRFADFRYTNFTGANLQSADLEVTNFEHAILDQANLRGVQARRSNFEYASLREADLRNANIESAELDFAFLDNSFHDMNTCKSLGLSKSEIQQLGIQIRDLRSEDKRKSKKIVSNL